MNIPNEMNDDRMNGPKWNKTDKQTKHQTKQKQTQTKTEDIVRNNNKKSESRVNTPK